jgi:FkbM family methyltransferase
MKKIKDILPEKFYAILLNSYNSLINDYATKTYSQEGEDLILRKLFGQKKNGFYIDVGAHHPKRFSNTYYFYKQGWQGINIEARPGSKNQFEKVRPRDINLENAIASEAKELTYYMFNEPALNGFSLPNVSNLKNHPEYKVIKEIKIHTQRLDAVLDKHLSENQSIDFLSIDVEGLDYDVLISNNWNIYRPNVVVIEDQDYRFNNESKISQFLKSHNYEMFARTYRTSFLRKT